jgi:superfamily II RNA helicase
VLELEWVLVFRNQDDNVRIAPWITGDATANHDAPVICCTAEILANIALRDGANAPVDDVIMDKFHYDSDYSHGAAWQIPLLTLPRARFLLMSATHGDSSFFSKQLSAQEKIRILVNAKAMTQFRFHFL